MATILLIEDEKLLREDIGEVLMLEGFDVLDAPNGRVGIQMAVEQQPDIILSDISMPEADGYEVLAALRGRPDTAEVPFIFLTARVDTEFVRKAESLGVDEYMTKPFSNADLMSTIRAFLRYRELLLSFHAANLESLSEQIARLVRHELRAYPVSDGLVEVIARQLDKAQVDRLLALVNSSHHHVIYLSRQLSNLIRLELGLISREKIQNMGMIVEAGLMLSSAVQQARQLSQRYQPDAVQVQGLDAPAFFQCDSHALRHSLADLVAQALAASPSGCAVRMEQQQTADQQLSITIGYDLSGQAQPGVPQLLHDAGDVLWLPEHIIQQHGGALKAESGGQVTILLPMVMPGARYGLIPS